MADPEDDQQIQQILVEVLFSFFLSMVWRCLEPEIEYSVLWYPANWRNFKHYTCYNPTGFWHLGNGWILAYSGLRIVAKFKAIRDIAIYEDPNRVANLQEEMQENAADIWVSLRAIQDRVKEIREFLGAATDEEDSDVQDSRGDGPSWKEDIYILGLYNLLNN